MDYYNRRPLKFHKDIPIFSEIDDYINNYFKISSDHIESITQKNNNPWIKQWVLEEMEKSTLRHVMNAISATGKSPIKILDVGVGLGRLLDRISKNKKINQSIDFYGMDISLPYLDIAHSNGLNVAMAKIEDMPYINNYFDIITCTDVLEHVEDLNLCISKILNCLKHGGVLIVRVPNREDLSAYLKTDYPYYFAHLRGFDEYSLELLFTRIFKLDLIDKSAGLYYENTKLLKYFPIHYLNLLIRGFLRSIKLFSKKLYLSLLPLVYHPTEINVVLRKPLQIDGS
jgi:2-polyprenyl-3-methyl-5-hydroxy-6-metoxy-1,4-benzoquinol methylase